MRKALVRNPARAADERNLVRILHLPQRVEVQRSIAGDLPEQLAQLDDRIVDKRIALEAERDDARICRKLCDFATQPVPLLHNLIVGRLCRCLLRIATVCHENEALGRHEKRRAVPAKATEIVDILLLRNQGGVHDPLREQRAQTCNPILYVHFAPPMRQIIASSAAI